MQKQNGPGQRDAALNQDLRDQALVELPIKAKEMRRAIIEMLCEAKSGHPGGSLSMAEIISALYFYELSHDPKNPVWDDRDRFVLSKGHGVPAVYAAMAMCGYFPRSELMTLRKTGARLQGHPDRVRLPGIEASTGSLGQGLSVAQGLALAARLKKKDYRVFCVLGDGECQEGQIWEAAMSAPKFQLGNLTAILDYNGGQIDGPVREVMSLEPIADKWRAFNWDVSVIDGHSFKELLSELEKTRDHKAATRPRMIIANTVKGKGVSFMEGKIEWHGVVPNIEQRDKALKEIGT